jgi:hypothetical protein
MVKFIRIIKPIEVINIDTGIKRNLFSGAVYKIVNINYTPKGKEVPIIQIEEGYYGMSFDAVNSFILITSEDLIYYFVLDALRFLQNLYITKTIDDRKNRNTS